MARKSSGVINSIWRPFTVVALALLSALCGFGVAMLSIRCPEADSKSVQTVYFSIDPYPSSINLDRIENINSELRGVINGAEVYLTGSGGIQLLIVTKSGSEASSDEIERAVNRASEMMVGLD